MVGHECPGVVLTFFQQLHSLEKKTMKNLIPILLLFVGVFFSNNSSAQSFENMRDFSGRYTGFLDGRNATLRISESRADGFPVLRFTLVDVDRGVTFTGVHYIPDMNVRQHQLEDVHLQTSEGGNRTLEKVLIHTWDTDHITVFNENNYGSLFSKDLDRSRQRTIGFREADDWLGTYLGSWDGRPSRLTITRYGSNGYTIAVQGTAPGSDRYEMSTTRLPNRSGHREHVLSGLLLGTGDGKSSTIGKMMMHTWNKNYISGTSIWRNTEYGFYFVRQ